MNKLIIALKSRTFYGAIGFAIVQYLGAQGIIDSNTLKVLESIMIALGLYGARNAKV